MDHHLIPALIILALVSGLITLIPNKRQRRGERQSKSRAPVDRVPGKGATAMQPAKPAQPAVAAEISPGYSSRRVLLSPAERSFFGVLLHACGPDAHVSCKVRLADVLDTVAVGSNWQGDFNRISKKHLDFVVCSASTMEIRCCVELNDKSHERQDREERDDFLSWALAGAGVPLVMFSARRGYSVTEVTEALGRVTAGA